MDILRNRKVQIAGQAVIITALVGGTGAFVALNKSVNLSVDGQSEQVRTFGSSVGDVLEAQGLEVDERDAVQPGAETRVERDMTIVVNTAKDLDLTVDGVPVEEWTTANTVGQALADLGVEAEGAEVSVPLDETLTEDGAAIEVVTPKGVTVKADGEQKVVNAAAATVSEVLSEAGIEVADEDIVSAPLTAPVSDGQVVDVLRVKNETTTVEEKIEKKTTVKESASMDRGETKVETEGKDGVREVVYDIRTVDGAEVKKEKVSEKVVSEPVDEVVVKGTRAPRPAAPEDDSSTGGGSDSGSSGDSGSDSGSGGSDSGDSGGTMSKQEIIDMLGGPGTRWYTIVKCESEFNPRAVNQQNRAHFGLFQFKLATWQSVGGKGNPIDASPQEQFKRAKILQEKAGWSQWACA
ncbi:resuscitation-promoting factor [Brevibacterium ihuae]|uniref:resuscitation-promoting factor n=1 Tax=Brevibacterium ihuae TaxID=1631743 RepID=UPI000C757332|nr:resuscitation-promoting factor [Brevibacterium ihuae]